MPSRSRVSRSSPCAGATRRACQVLEHNRRLRLDKKPRRAFRCSAIGKPLNKRTAICCNAKGNSEVWLRLQVALHLPQAARASTIYRMQKTSRGYGPQFIKTKQTCEASPHVNITDQSYECGWADLHMKFLSACSKHGLNTKPN